MIYSLGQYLCPPTQYAPGSLQTLTVSSATLAAVSSANVNTGNFEAPASGNVLVTASFVWKTSVNGDNGAFALAEHGTVSPLVANAIVATNNSNAWISTVQFLVTGLTPGQVYNFDLLFSSPNGAVTTIFALGQNSTTPSTSTSAPVVMTVQAI